MTETLPPQPPLKRGRGRPRKDPGSFVPLTRELIAAQALRIAGSEGYAELTMHRLAEELGVTPRALYNHVSHRQEVINLAVELFLANTPPVRLDPEQWRSSVRAVYRGTRAVYRAYPRAALISVDERLSVGGGVRRIELVERLLGFYTELGLTLRQAVALTRSMEREVFGFVQLVDYYFDRDAGVGRGYASHPVPDSWLERHPDTPAELSRAALELPVQDNDAQFEELIEQRLMVLDALLAGHGTGQAGSELGIF